MNYQRHNNRHYKKHNEHFKKLIKQKQELVKNAIQKWSLTIPSEEVIMVILLYNLLKNVYF